MNVLQWKSTDGPLTEAALRRKLESLGYFARRYTYPPGTVFEAHSHDVDKIDAVISGQFRVTMGGEAVILGPGQYIYVPKGVEHTAEVVGSEDVVSLDAVRRR